MNHTPGTRFSAATAAEAARDCELGDEARRLLHGALTPAAYVAALQERACYDDALRFLAYALPKRAAVWWACLCLWHGGRPEPGNEAAEVLQAAYHWVRDPSEEHRRAAGRVAEAAVVGTPHSALAYAVFWSGGSMIGPGLPVVPPPPYLTARAVAVALAGEVLRHPADQLEATNLLFLRLASEVADGTLPWELEPGAPS